MTNTEIIQAIQKEIISRIDKRHLSTQAKNELVSILSFLDSLESEKPTTVEGLEEEMERFMSNLTEKKGVFPPLTRLGFKAIARNFYELGRQSKSIGWSEKDTNILSHIILTLAGFMSEGKSIDWLKELPYRIQLSESKMNEDLEKEIESFWDSFYRKETRKHSQINNDFRIVARHFAQWMREKMVNEAVEGEVCGKLSDHLNIRHSSEVQTPDNLTRIFCNTDGFKVGNKVKLIIIKED